MVFCAHNACDACAGAQSVISVLTVYCESILVERARRKKRHGDEFGPIISVPSDSGEWVHEPGAHLLQSSSPMV